MIEVILWTRDDNGVPIDEVSLKCESFTEGGNKLSYVSSRTKKGRKRQSWYSTYKNFSLSFVELPQLEKEKLERIINEKNYGHQLFYNNAIYDIMIEGDSNDFTPTFSPSLGVYIYDGSLELEEISSESDPLDSYMQSPIVTFPIYKKDEISVEGYIIGGNTIELYSYGFISDDPSTYMSKFDFDALSLYAKASYLISPIANFQGAKSPTYGVVKNQKIDFYNGDLVSSMEDVYYKNDKHVASVNSTYSSYHVGGEYYDTGSYIRTTAISKRDFDTESATESSMVLSDGSSKLMGTGNSQVGILAGGEYDSGVNTKVLKEVDYFIDSLSELAVQLDSSYRGQATLTSQSKAYFIGGYDYDSLAYSKNVNSYDYGLNTISLLSDVIILGFEYADGVNAEGSGMILKNGLGSEIEITLAEIVDFNFDGFYDVLTSLEWAYPASGASCFQSGSGNY